MTEHYIGKGIPRIDGLDKVTGRGQYIQDICLPQMLYAKVLRSPYAHARIISIDTSKAEALSGVKAVATFLDTTQKLFNPCPGFVTTHRPDKPVYDQQIFTSEARFVGDEIAAVAAMTPEIAEKAVKQILVKYEILPAVFDIDEALKADAPLVHGELTDKNICGPLWELNLGDIKSGMDEGDVFAEATVLLPRAKHAQLEPHGALADWKNGRLTVFSQTQTLHPVKMILARILDMPESRIQVKGAPYVGGTFGAGQGVRAKTELIASVLAMRTGRPVKLMFDRAEDFGVTDTRHGGYITGKLAAKKDGTFTAFEIDTYLNTGAYAGVGPDVALTVGPAGTGGTYRVPNWHYRARAVYTNQQQAGAFRGYGNPQGNFLTETLVDDIARQLSIDPVKLRLKNTVMPGDKWFIPFPCTSTGLNQCFEKAARAIGWDQKRGQTGGGARRRGVGIAGGTHFGGPVPFVVDYDTVYMRLENDGSLHVAAGVAEVGSGAATALLQIASDAVGVPMETAQIVYGDTDTTPFDIGSHASRSVISVGNAILKSGTKLKESVLAYASEFLGVDKNVLRMTDGIIDGGGKEISVRQLAYEAHLDGKSFFVAEQNQPQNSPPWYAQAVEVEVDMETGKVRILKVAAFHDVGNVINPVIASGQLEGGIMQGVGYATMEEMKYLGGKRPITDSYQKYLIPTIQDMPEIEIGFVEEPCPEGPLGARGLGEVGIIPVAAAIASAVEDATGIRFHQLPLTPERVLCGIEEAVMSVG